MNGLSSTTVTSHQIPSVQPAVEKVSKLMFARINEYKPRNLEGSFKPVFHKIVTICKE